jgi:hypothetical protein
MIRAIVPSIVTSTRLETPYFRLGSPDCAEQVTAQAVGLVAL